MLQIQESWFHLCYIGAMLILFIYNLLFFFIAKDRAYIFYSFFVLFNAGYIFYAWMRTTPALGITLIPGYSEYIEYYALQIFPGIVFYGLFLQAFLNLKTKLKRWHTYLNYYILSAIPLALICLFIFSSPALDNHRGTLILVLYILVGSLIGLFMVIPLFRSGENTAFFFILGLLFMVTGVFISASSFLRFGRTPQFLSYFQIGSLLEVIFFSLGLGYKQLINEREKQKAKIALLTAQMEQEKEQEEARRLQELNEVKTRFYTNITHEFRTPLTVIMGMMDQIDGNEQERSLILRNSKNLLRLVNQLLDLSKLESGVMETHLIQTDIIRYLQYLTESFYSAAEENRIDLTFNTEVPELIMDYDEIKIQQIVYNIVSNALKFTQKNGQVALNVWREHVSGEACLFLEIKDTGIGIPAGQLPHIFDQFFQVDSSTTRQGEGSGVGLALTKELVTLLGGEIQVKSEVEKGTTFLLKLPIRKGQNTPVKVGLPTFGLNTEFKIDTNGQTNGRHEPKAADSGPDSEERPLLLVIEDNRDVVSYIIGLLQKDYQIEIAFDGKKGIEKALELVPDIIISDVMMPEKDGFEVCASLKTDQRTCHIPIILLTAKATAADRLAGLKTGADAYLMKPFNKEELLVRLDNLIALRQTLQQHYAQAYHQESASGLFRTSLEKEPTLDEIFLRKIRETIDEKLGEPDLGVNNLCEEVHLSHAQVFRKLKALTGKNPSSFIRKVRLQKARELLLKTSLNVTQVAYEVGFTDPNYFSRTFAKEFGMPPSTVKS